MDKRTPNPAAQIWGAGLRFWREKAGLTVDEVANRIRNSPHTVVSWERGARTPNLDTINALDCVLATDGALLVGIDHLAIPRFPGGYAKYPEVEARCTSLYAYSTMAVPGLLQTEEYARAAISESVPPLDDDEIETLVSARISRQQLLGRRPPAVLGFVIEESILRRPIGSTNVMRRQLERILGVAELRHVTIQIMEQICGRHSGLEGPMILIRTADGRDVAYIEGQSGGDWVEDTEQVAVMTQRYGIIRTQALRTPESIKLIHEILGET